MSLELDILKGVHDKDLKEIIAARSRHQILTQTNAAVTLAELEIGQRVRFLQIRPAYMVGQTGIVIKKQRTKLVVQLDSPMRRFDTGPITVPASCVELMPDWSPPKLNFKKP
jgi:hypothetical protein